MKEDSLNTKLQRRLSDGEFTIQGHVEQPPFDWGGTCDGIGTGTGVGNVAAGAV